MTHTQYTIFFISSWHNPISKSKTKIDENRIWNTDLVQMLQFLFNYNYYFTFDLLSSGLIMKLKQKLYIYFTLDLTLLSMIIIQSSHIDLMTFH